MLAEHSWGLLLLQSPKTDPEPCAMKHQGLFPGRVIPKFHTSTPSKLRIFLSFAGTHTHTKFTIWPGILYALSSMQMSPAPLIAGMLMKLTPRQGWLSWAVLQPARCHSPAPCPARQRSHASGCSKMQRWRQKEPGKGKEKWCKAGIEPCFRLTYKCLGVQRVREQGWGSSRWAEILCSRCRRGKYGS